MVSVALHCDVTSVACIMVASICVVRLRGAFSKAVTRDTKQQTKQQTKAEKADKSRQTADSRPLIADKQQTNSRQAADSI